MGIVRYTVTQDQINEITNHINMYRLRHHSKLITYNETITNFSQLYAEKLATTNTFQHSGNKLYGENLAYFGGYVNNMVALVKKAIDSWYSEVSKYNYSYPGYTSGTGHFTALVWDSTSSFGFGYAYNTVTRRAFIVMNFYPPGNIRGLYQQNVFRI